MLKLSTLKIAVVSALGLSLGLTTEVVVAQELEEVLVTARKREENLQRVPVAISAISAATIANAGLVRVQDITDLVPNMTHQETISNKATNFTLRGISSSGGLGNDPALGVYVDEVYVSRESGFNADLMDIERIEVLKGPQGTTFGRNTAVGALNITTKKPSQEFEGQVLADFGDYGYSRYGLLISGPLTDEIAAKFSVVDSERDGYLDNSFGGTVNTVDYTTYRAQVRWDPTDRLSMLLTGDYRKDNSDGNNLVTRNAGDPLNKNYRVDIPDSGSEDVKAKGVSLHVSYDLDNFSITSISSYNQIDESYVNDQDWSPLDALWGLDERDNDQYSQELRIDSTGDGALQWVAGVYLYHQKFKASQNAINGADSVYAAFGLDDMIGSGIPPTDIGLPVDTVEILATSEITSDSYAAFVSMDYAFNDNWSVTAGVRYSKDEKDLDYNQMADPLAIAFGFVPLDISDDIDDDDWSPTFSVNWQPTDVVLVYAKYSRGHKAGGFNNSISNTASALAFKPETMDAYELGLKSTWLGNTLRLNGAAFYMKYDDKQESAFVTGVGFVQTNAGEAKSKGAEVELEWLPMEGLTLVSSVGYADAEYEDYVIDELTDNTGNDLTRAPKWTFSVGGQYDWVVSPGLRGLFRVDYHYQDDFFTQANNDPFFAADSQNLVHARLGIRSAEDTWSATLWGRNLTDDDNINTIDGPSTFFFDTYHYSLIAPRTYGVELKYSF